MGISAVTAGSKSCGRGTESALASADRRGSSASMQRARFLRLAVSLTLALFAAGLGGVSVYRKVASFQPLGFEPLPQGGGMAVAAVDPPKSELRPGDLILSVNAGEVPTRSQLVQRLEERPESELTVLRGDQLLQIRYHRLPL